MQWSSPSCGFIPGSCIWDLFTNPDLANPEDTQIVVDDFQSNVKNFFPVIGGVHL